MLSHSLLLVPSEACDHAAHGGWCQHHLDRSTLFLQPCVKSAACVVHTSGCPVCTSVHVYHGYAVRVASEWVHDEWILPSGNKAFRVMLWIIPPQYNPLTFSHSRNILHGRTSIISFYVWQRTWLLHMFAESVLKLRHLQTRGYKPEKPTDLLRGKRPGVYYEIAGH